MALIGLLAVTGCLPGGNAKATDPPASGAANQAPEPTESEPDDSEPAQPPASGDVTAPGTQLKQGETAVVPYTYAYETQNIAVTVTGVRMGSVSDFADFKDAEKNLVDKKIFYVEIEVTQAGPTTGDMKYASLGTSDFEAHDQDGSRIGSPVLIGKLNACPRPDFGAEFGNGAVAKQCVVFTGTSLQNLASVGWTKGDDYSWLNGNPITWSMK